MAEDQENPQNLSIRCPSCRQRFSVDADLMDRMVECGGCDSRFRIDDDVIIRAKKFYPGERNSPQLNRFQRVPMSAASAPPEGMQTMRYEEFNHPEQLGPASPQRVIAGVFGVILMAATALLLILSASQGAAFNSMTFTGKLIVAGFSALVGFVLLIYANPRGRLKAVIFGLMLAAGVVCIPFFVKGREPVATASADPMSGIKEPASSKEGIDPIVELRKKYGTGPLEKEQSRLSQSESGMKAYGIFMKGLIERNKYTARDFLIRDTVAAVNSHPYPRDDGDYLMVLTGVSMNLEEVAAIAGKLGRVEEKFPEIGVIVVRVSNDQFLAGSAEKLNDNNHPAFYELNMRELESIDLDRVKRAVERLGEAEPTIYRKDISTMLSALLAKPGVGFHNEISRALLKWGTEGDQASTIALKVLKRDVAANSLPPESLVELVVRDKNPDAIPTLNSIWIKNPEVWSAKFAKLGAAIEPMVLEQINAEDAPLKRSAIKLLGKAGTAKSLPVLRKLMDAEDPEVRVLAERSVKSISGR